jgi:hypothetical protein
MSGYICEVCLELKGASKDHSRCSRILQVKYRDKDRRPRPPHLGIIKAYKSLYERF